VKKIIVISCLIFFSLALLAQQRQKSSTRFSVNGGLGIVHYLNTLEVGADIIKENHLGFSFRAMWEPEHRLAIGLETGYYTFYTLSKSPSKNNPLSGESSLVIIPIFINLRMRIVPNFYLTAGTGAAILLSETTVLGSTASSSQLSLSDFQTSALYLRPINSKLSWGGELKYLNIGKTEDASLSLQAIICYKF
jgi:hypothetical protein